jgi:hypothetical protein
VAIEILVNCSVTVVEGAKDATRAKGANGVDFQRLQRLQRF